RASSRRGPRRTADRSGEQLVDREILRPARRPHLPPRALVRILVVAEPHELRAVAEAALLELVEAHLDDELRLHGLLLELSGAPTVRLREAAVALRVEQRQHLRRDLLVPLRADRGRPDVVQVSVVGIETEQERRNRGVAAGLEAHAGD